LYILSSVKPFSVRFGFARDKDKTGYIRHNY